MPTDNKALVAGARSVVTKVATVKAANPLSGLLDGAKNVLSKVDLKNPVHTGVLGAGAGALGGLASGAMSDEEEPGYLQRALMGGLAGGGIGAGAGMLHNKMTAQPGPPTPVPPVPTPEELAAAGIKAGALAIPSKSIQGAQAGLSQAARSALAGGAAGSAMSKPIRSQITPSGIPGAAAGARAALQPRPQIPQAAASLTGGRGALGGAQTGGMAAIQQVLQSPEYLARRHSMMQIPSGYRPQVPQAAPPQ